MTKRALRVLALALALLLCAFAWADDAIPGDTGEPAAELQEEQMLAAELEEEEAEAIADALEAEEIVEAEPEAELPVEAEVEAEESEPEEYVGEETDEAVILLDTEVLADLSEEELEAAEVPEVPEIAEEGEGETPESEATEEPTPTETPAPTVTPTPTPAPTPIPVDPITAPLKLRKITLTKSKTKSVYARIPYRVVVKGQTLYSCKSKNTSVAITANDGRILPLKKGTAKIIVKTTAGKKYTLTLKVLKMPAPTNLKLSVSSKGVYKLKWKAAKYASGYSIQVSTDKKKWTEAMRVGAGKVKQNITSLATKPCYFRVQAILGERKGGKTGALSILGKVTNVKVVCEESYLYGPSNDMNVKWKAAPGAAKYIVYRATLPSTSYKKVGTTTKTWFADNRDPKKLYSYRVSAVYRNANLGSVTTEMSQAATLWSGMEGNVLPPASLRSSTGVLLLVNKRAQVVTAYVRDARGNYTLPLRHMICSSGRVYDRTVNGTYTLYARTGQWVHYPSGVYVRYPSTYRSGYYFHSPLYNSNKTVRSSTVSALGTRQSLGCVRLKVNDAKWVFDYCGEGTTVYICDGAAKPSLKSAIRPRDVSVKGF